MPGPYELLQTPKLPKLLPFNFGNYQFWQYWQLLRSPLKRQCRSATLALDRNLDGAHGPAFYKRRERCPEFTLWIRLGRRIVDFLIRVGVKSELLAGSKPFAADQGQLEPWTQAH